MIWQQFLRGAAVAIGICLTCAAVPALAGQATPPAASATCDRDATDQLTPTEQFSQLNRCIDALELAGEAERAIAVYERIIVIARELGDRRQEAESLVGMGGMYRAQSQYDRAETAIQAGLALYQEIGNVGEEGDGWTALGRLATQRGDYRLAREHHTTALDRYTRTGSQLGIAIGNNNIGATYLSAGERLAALPYFDASLAALRLLGDRLRSATVLDNIAGIRRDVGNPDGALNYLRESLAIREEFNDRLGIAKAQEGMAQVHKRTGDYAAALDWMHRSLDLRQQVGTPQQVAESLNNVADVYVRLGSHRMAAQYLEQALTLARQIEKQSLQAEVLTNLAEALFLGGERAKAFDRVNEALAIGRTLNFDMTLAYANLVLGRMRLASGDARSAVVPLEGALQFYERVGDRIGQADALVALAEATRVAGTPARALQHATQARDLGTGSGMLDVEWRALTALGRLAAARGERARARALFTDAVNIVEAMRESAPAHAGSLASFLESRLDPYHERLVLAAASSAAADAFADAERSKARVLVDIMNGAPDAGRLLPADDRAQEADLRIRLSGLNGELLALAQAARPDRARVMHLTGERERLRTEYDALFVRAAAQNPAVRLTRGALTSATAADAQRLSRQRRAAIIEYVVTRRQIWALVITPERVRATRLPATPAEAARLVSDLRTRIQDRDLRVSAAARAAYDRLFAPLAPLVAGRGELIIVPDGVLWDLPFQALRSPSGRYLVEDVALSLAPSVTALLQMSAAPGAPPQPTSGLLAIGNPTVPSAAPVARRMTLMDGRLEPLPDAEAQVRQVAAMYPSPTVMLGEDAREDAWKRVAPPHRVLHFATHGVVDDASPMHSFVLLTRPDGGSDDGLLEAWEVMGLSLRADLVILSACETARGRVSSGEGVTGLMWSFFVAGAPSLVVSQWKVEASSSTAQMVGFHRAWAAGRASKTAALRQSMLQLMKTADYAHPFYWAGYVVAGDAR